MSDEDKQAMIDEKQAMIDEKEAAAADKGRRLAESSGWERLKNNFQPTTAAITAD